MNEKAYSISLKPGVAVILERIAKEKNESCDHVIEDAGHKNEHKKKILCLSGSFPDDEAEELLRTIRESRVNKVWREFE
ncbi:hypothetical protein GF389_00500 [Candidatus Dojkabacteria bacterium]|nr:hypothetical protein [Candidatus Dojkabacteria bacterium]